MDLSRSRVKVVFYGRLAETIAPELDVAAPAGCSIAELRDTLIGQHPQASEVLASRRALTCVGEALVRDDHIVAADEIVEFLPPVSGG